MKTGEYNSFFAVHYGHSFNIFPMYGSFLAYFATHADPTHFQAGQHIFSVLIFSCNPANWIMLFGVHENTKKVIAEIIQLKIAVFTSFGTILDNSTNDLRMS